MSCYRFYEFLTYLLLYLVFRILNFVCCDSFICFFSSCCLQSLPLHNSSHSFNSLFFVYSVIVNCNNQIILYVVSLCCYLSSFSFVWFLLLFHSSLVIVNADEEWFNNESTHSYWNLKLSNCFPLLKVNFFSKLFVSSVMSLLTPRKKKYTEYQFCTQIVSNASFFSNEHICSSIENFEIIDFEHERGRGKHRWVG